MFDFLFDFFSPNKQDNIPVELETSNEEIPTKKRGIRKTERKKRTRNITKRYRNRVSKEVTVDDI